MKFSLFRLLVSILLCATGSDAAVAMSIEPYKEPDVTQLDGGVENAFSGDVDINLSVRSDGVVSATYLPGLHETSKLLTVNQKSVRGLSPFAVRKLLQGDIGTEVKLEVLPPDGHKMFVITRRVDKRHIQRAERSTASSTTGVGMCAPEPPLKADDLRNWQESKDPVFLERALNAPENVHSKMYIALKLLSFAEQKGEADEISKATKRVEELAESGTNRYSSIAYSQMAQGSKDAQTQLKYALRVVQLAGVEDERDDFRLPILLQHSTGFIESLVRAGKAEDARALLEKLAEVVGKRFGETSKARALCLAELALFDADAAQYDAMDKSVNQIIEAYQSYCDKPTFDFDFRSDQDPIQLLNELAVRLSSKGQRNRGLDMMKRITAIQESRLPQPNLQLSRSLIALSRIYVQDKQPKKAEPLMKRAVEMEDQFDEDKLTTNKLRAEYADILRQLNRSKEADLMCTVPFQKPSAKARTYEFADKLPSYRQEELQAWFRTLSSEESETPYGRSTFNSVRALANLFFQAEDWKEAEKYYEWELEFYKRGAGRTHTDYDDCVRALDEVRAHLKKSG